jgi:hypothetical protein
MKWRVYLKYCPKCSTLKGLDSFCKAKNRPDGLYNYCKLCKRKAAAISYSKNKESIAKARAATYSISKINLEWYSKERVRLRQYKRDNKGKVNYHTAKRRVTRKSAIPNWGELNDFIIREAYELSQLRGELISGTKWHVDHIYPLSPACNSFSGLHVGINLQVILDKENLSKGNRLQYKDMI